MSHKQFPFLKAPRCHAASKRTRQTCRNPAVRGRKVCRHHGGFAGAPKGNQNALKAGRYTAEAAAQRSEVLSLLERNKSLIRST